MAQPSFATSIVVLITRDYIVLGADSKRLILNDQSDVTARQSVCKIRKAGNYCYALAGFVASRSTGFSADSLVQAHLQTTTDYNKAIAAIKRAIKKALRRELQYQKDNQPASFSKKAIKEPVLEIVVLRMENNVPAVQIIGFELTDAETITVTDYTASCPGDCPTQPVQVYFLGEYNGMEKYLDQNRALTDPVALVEQLITVQSKTTPSSVGGPVNVIKFSAAGVEWLK